MPFVGNDIVDLKDPANARKSTDLRYLRKILTDSEINMVAAADDSAAVLWSIWASKEAAYKVIAKDRFDMPFIPRLWSWQGQCPGVGMSVGEAKAAGDKAGVMSSHHTDLPFISGQVNIPERGIVYIRQFLFSSCAHCIASDCSEVLSKAIWQIEPAHPRFPGDETDLSLAGRKALVRHLSVLLNVSASDMRIIRERREGQLLFPRVYCHNEPLPVDISLSHDGSFAAYAFYLA